MRIDCLQKKRTILFCTKSNLITNIFSGFCESKHEAAAQTWKNITVHLLLDLVQITGIDAPFSVCFAGFMWRSSCIWWMSRWNALWPVTRWLLMLCNGASTRATGDQLHPASNSADPGLGSFSCWNMDLWFERSFNYGSSNDILSQTYFWCWRFPWAAPGWKLGDELKFLLCCFW